MSCELCGKQATTKARIEGALLSVCASCATMGTELKAKPAPIVRTMQREAKPEMYLVGDYMHIVRRARQQMKLTEKDAALKLGIKESTLLHIEAGKVPPDDSTAKRLERFYNIKLFEQA